MIAASGEGDWPPVCIWEMTRWPAGAARRAGWVWARTRHAPACGRHAPRAGQGQAGNAHPATNHHPEPLHLVHHFQLRSTAPDRLAPTPPRLSPTPARSVPFEVRVQNDKEPIYDFTLEDLGRVNEQPVLPFNAYGTLAWARNEFENNSASSQVGGGSRVRCGESNGVAAAAQCKHCVISFQALCAAFIALTMDLRLLDGMVGSGDGLCRIPADEYYGTCRAVKAPLTPAIPQPRATLVTHQLTRPPPRITARAGVLPAQGERADAHRLQPAGRPLRRVRVHHGGAGRAG